MSDRSPVSEPFAFASWRRQSAACPACKLLVSSRQEPPLPPSRSSRRGSREWPGCRGARGPGPVRGWAPGRRTGRGPRPHPPPPRSSGRAGCGRPGCPGARGPGPVRGCPQRRTDLDITLSNGEAPGRTLTEPPIWTVTRLAVVTISVAPERSLWHRAAAEPAGRPCVTGNHLCEMAGLMRDHRALGSASQALGACRGSCDAPFPDAAREYFPADPGRRLFCAGTVRRHCELTTDSTGGNP